MTRSDACPLCGENRFEPIVTRPRTPVHQHQLSDSRDAARAQPCGDLSMVVCTACGFVFNATFDASKMRYDADYENTQCCSPHFLKHMQDLASGFLDRHRLKNARLIEIGCGKGDFLKILCSDRASGNIGHGFDPTYVGPDTALDGRVRFTCEFYDARWSDVPADAVLCRHVIEHIAAPLDLLRAVRRALGDRRDVVVAFETPCVDWILDNRVFWDFFYEHCSLFSASTLTRAFESAGFAVDTVRHVFGGQYLWIEARPAADGARRGPRGEATPAKARAYRAAEQAALSRCRAELERLRDEGPVCLWGAGAKGATLAHVLDPEAAVIDCLVDVNPAKQGRFSPGSGHPIVAPSALAARGVASAIVMNPNYRVEIEEALRALGAQVRLFDWSMT